MLPDGRGDSHSVADDDVPTVETAILMVVGVLEIVFQIPAAQSLKEKRKVVLSLKDRIRKRFNVSLSETDGQNTWQTCRLAVAMVAVRRTAVERELNRVLDLIESDPSVVVTDQWIDFC